MSESPAEACGMYGSTAVDTIAGAKLLQVRFGSSFILQPDQSVIHGDRRARFIRMSDGAAIIRYWDDNRAIAVPPESLSLPGDDESEDVGRTPRPRTHPPQPLARRNRVARARASAETRRHVRLPRPTP
jgi:hypothetical protein